MIVRDLLIQFGSQLDKKSLDNVEAQAKKSSKFIQKLFSAAFIVGAAKAAFSLNKLASDVIENRNVLNNVFEDNAKAVEDWALAYGRATGRNRYDMEYTAATLGAVLNPMMEKNAEAAAEMSTRLSELAVDLGSMYNAADEDVMGALKSGLTGATMPLRRFGIVMSEATLSSFALSQGIKGNVKDMSVAELTHLRYLFILDQTTAAHGDAARTQFEWANSKKATIGLLKELATTAGMKLYPILTRLLNVTRSAINSFLKLTESSNILTSILIVLGGVVTAIGIKLLIAFWPVILPVLKLAAIIGILVLLVEDFITFLQGGDSVIGRFIDSIFGPGSAEEAVRFLNKAFEFLKELFFNYILPAIKQVIKWLGKFVIEAGKFAAEFIKVFINRIVKGFEWLSKMYKKYIAPVLGTIGKLLGLDQSFNMKTIEETTSTPGGREALMNRARAEHQARMNTNQAGAGSVTINNHSEVNVRGNADLQTANRIVDKATKEQDLQAKRTAAAVRQRGRK